jgi:hypothetical protein
MKKLLSIVGTLALVLVPMASISADSAPVSTDSVEGYVSQNNSPATGATVTATCNGATGSTTTYGNSGPESPGDYSLTLSPSGLCTSTDTVTVVAHKGGASGQTSQPYGSLGVGNVNIALVNVSIVPELGALTGAGAAILGGAAFMVVRRKHINQN